MNSKIPCEFGTIVFASVRSGDESDICTRRMGRPPSAVVTLPLMVAVPLTTGAVGSRGCPCGGGGTVVLTGRRRIRATAATVMQLPGEFSLLVILRKTLERQVQRASIVVENGDPIGDTSEALEEELPRAAKRRVDDLQVRL